MGRMKKYKESISPETQLIYNRLRSRREELRMTKKELSERLGYASPASIGRIESGQTNLSLPMLLDMMHALDISPRELFAEPDDSLTKVPVYNSLTSGLSFPQQSGLRGYIHIDWLPVERYFGLRMQDDAMAPLLRKGDTAICSYTYVPKANGDIQGIGIVTAEGKQAVCRKLYYNHETGSMTLKAVNSDFGDIEYTKTEIQILKVEIIGMVQAVIHRTQENDI